MTPHRRLLPFARFIRKCNRFFILAASDQLRKVIQLLETHNVTCSNLVLSLLQDAELQGQPCSNDLVDHASEILSAFHKHPGSSKSTFEWASNVMKARYAQSVTELTRKENGWHFGALHTSAEQLKDFKIEEMAEKMEDLAPELWDLLGLLLSADKRQTKRRQRDAKAREADGDQIMGSTDGVDPSGRRRENVEDDAMVDDVNIGEASNPNYGQSFSTAVERREALATIVRECYISFVFMA